MGGGQAQYIALNPPQPALVPAGQDRELRSTAADDDTSADEAMERRRTASDWELASYRLSLNKDALSRYDEYSDTPPATA